MLLQLGSLYIPPPGLDDKEYLLSQQSPQWMSTKKSLDTPEWVDRDEIDNFIQQTRLMHTPGPREHVIPLSFEKTPSKTPMTPGFGPTPFYGSAQQQFSNVVSPKVGQYLGENQNGHDLIMNFSDPNANQFVDQGYNNIDFPSTAQPPRNYAQNQKLQQQPQQQQQFQQSAGVRIIPIQVEGARSPQTEQTVVMQR